MIPNDIHGDAVLAAMRALRTIDVSPDHAQRLRTQCHSGLERQVPSSGSSRSREAGVWQRVLHVVAGAWCVLYVLETIHWVAAAYGL